jgi:hypothetical protein
MDADKENLPASGKRKYCFICGLMEKGISLFRVPSGKLKLWSESILKPGLTTRSLLCEAHFDISEISKNVKVGSEYIKLPRTRLVSKDVLPSKLLGGIKFFNYFCESC